MFNNFSAGVDVKSMKKMEESTDPKSRVRDAADKAGDVKPPQPY